MKVPPIQLSPTMERLPLPLPFSPELLWRYPLAFPQQSPSSPLLEKPPGLVPDPRLWNRDDVIAFLRWCEKEFDLPTFEIEKFQMNGKALCLLNKSDLAERAPGAGDVIYNIVQLIVRDAPAHVPSSPATPNPRPLTSPSTTLPPTSTTWPIISSDYHNLGHLIHQSNSVTLSPAPSVDSQSGSPQHHEHTNHLNVFSNNNNGSSVTNGSQSDSDDSIQDSSSPQHSPATPTGLVPPLSPGYRDPPTSSPREQGAIEPEPSTNGRLLWDFLQQLLNDPAQRYSHYIAWKNRDTGVFKIVDPAGLARLWGIQKNHLSMNYDKMSRALRYYYRVNILRKVQGERHSYQFLRNPNELKSIKNISLLRQQMAATRPSLKPEASEFHECDDMPTDLSMDSSEREREVHSDHGHHIPHITIKTETGGIL